MWFYKNGMKTYICVDNYFPVMSEKYKGGGRPIFAKSQGNELWPAVAEKCYAKYHKGYVIIEGGNPKTPKPQLNEIYLTPKRLNF